jgi:hypothetical protein
MTMTIGRSIESFLKYDGVVQVVLCLQYGLIRVIVPNSAAHASELVGVGEAAASIELNA